MKVIIKNEEYYHSFNLDTVTEIADNRFNETIKMSTIDNKYFIIQGSIYGMDWIDLNIFDETGLVFNVNGLDLEYNIYDGKITYSCYDKATENDVNEITGYYKVYYEIIEENGILKSSEVSVDYEDVKGSAQS